MLWEMSSAVRTGEFIVIFTHGPIHLRSSFMEVSVLRISLIIDTFMFTVTDSALSNLPAITASSETFVWGSSFANLFISYALVHSYS